MLPGRFMPAIAAVVVAHLAQAPPAPSSPTRFNVTLEFHGVWGLVTEANGACPGATGGTDTLTGSVTKTGVSDEGIEYSGRLTRTTGVALCETRETATGTRWCVGGVTGHGTFLVTITIPLDGHDNENASVVMEPDSNVHADVDGNCDSLDNAGVKADYEDGDTLYFETANHAAARVLPTGGLVPGTWWQTRRDPTSGYKLVVAVVP
jgi:hypothetical protein